MAFMGSRSVDLGPAENEAGDHRRLRDLGGTDGSCYSSPARPAARRSAVGLEDCPLNPVEDRVQKDKVVTRLGSPGCAPQRWIFRDGNAFCNSRTPASVTLVISRLNDWSCLSPANSFKPASVIGVLVRSSVRSSLCRTNPFNH